MKVEIEYKNGRVEVYKTSDESGIGSNVLARPRGESYSNLTSAAVMIAPRFDLLDKEGLRIDIMWYSPSIEEETSHDNVDDYPGGAISIPNMNFEIGRIWRLLDLDMLEDVEAISIDNRWHIERQGGFLVNTTQFLRQQNFLLSHSTKSKSIANQVVLLHEHIRQMHPDWSDEKIANYYGYPLQAYLAAANATLLGEDESVIHANISTKSAPLLGVSDSSDDSETDSFESPTKGPRHAFAPEEVDYFPIMVQLLENDPDLTAEDMVHILEKRGAPSTALKSQYKDARNNLTHIENFVKTRWPQAQIHVKNKLFNNRAHPAHMSKEALYLEDFDDFEDEVDFDYSPEDSIDES